jgi:threonine dehydrogenase-like Zn-dependent dehydrogenase
MTVGLAATAIAVLLGAAIGIVSGYFGRRLDLALQRVVDAWLAFPGLVMVIVLLVLLGPGLGSVILALGISQAFRSRASSAAPRSSSASTPTSRPAAPAASTAACCCATSCPTSSRPSS